MKRPPALVLTAGLGTRLRPLTYARAKGGVPVNGVPLVQRVASWLRTHGFTDLVFNLHHHPATITSVLGDGSGLGVRVRYSWENPVLGSAGGPRHALPLLLDDGADHFLIVNGDTLTDVDIDALLTLHTRSGAAVTMALIPNPAPEKYGGVLVGDDGFVRGFSRRGSRTDTFHFIGMQVVNADVFSHLEDGVPSESVAALYPAMIEKDSRSVAAFTSPAVFHDIGTPDDLLRTSLTLAASEGPKLIGEGTVVDPSAVITRSALWDDVTIGPRVTLVECVVADGVNIPAGTRYERRAIAHHEGALVVQPL